MATLVFQDGTITQTQVGPADIIATFKAAYDVYGWLGGLDSIRFLLSKVPNVLRGNIRKLRFNTHLQLHPTSAVLLTSSGPRPFTIDNADECFSGDPCTQLIGFTICALAHELMQSISVNLFMEFLAPNLFGCSKELADAVHSQLQQNSTITRILNEGASRGLTTVFNAEAAKLRLPVGDKVWLKKELWNQEEDCVLKTEEHLVGGLLKWLGNQTGSPYFTRSGLVARLGSHLKVVGYALGAIKTWDGTGPVPAGLGPNALILVLGGHYPTDPLMLENEETIGGSRLFHYTTRTIGGLLLDALEYQDAIYPETLQNDFDRIHDFISSHVNVQWKLNKKEFAHDIVAKFEFAADGRTTSIERKLASMYFPMSANAIAPCYRSIGSEGIMEVVQSSGKRHASAAYDHLDCEIARFRAVTAAIVISLTSMLSRDTFENIRHLILLDLTDDSWLEDMCKVLDNGVQHGLSLSHAAHMLACVHAGKDPQEQKEMQDVVGWRNGTYNVLPTIFHTFDPVLASVGFTCSDKFLANLPVREDGGICSSPTPFAYQDDCDSSSFITAGQISAVRQDYQRVEPASRGAPDCPLYLSLGRPLHFGSCSLQFVGRVDGSVVGTVGVHNVLKTILLSEAIPTVCGHIQRRQVRSISASRWVAQKRVKPTGTKKHPAYLAVQGDSTWTLFLAGEAFWFNARIVQHCIDCAVDSIQIDSLDASVVLIGYY